jgi:hypothetical protein
MEIKYPHMDPEQRAQLLCDYTGFQKKVPVVGCCKEKRKERVPITVMKEMWDELTSSCQLSGTRRNNAFYYIAREMGYRSGQIERVVEVGINRDLALANGRSLMEYSHQLSEAWAAIEESLNR